MTLAALKDEELRNALIEAALSALDVALGSTQVFLQPPQLERLFPLPSRLTRRYKGRVDASFGRLEGIAPTRASPFQRRLVIAAFSNVRWTERIRARWDRLLRRPAPSPAILDPARRAIAASVWLEPGFCRVVSTRVYRCLRHEVLMSPSKTQIPAFSSDFWWVLIGTLADRSALGVALREAALESGESQGWAGFWEQYLLLRLTRSGRELLGRSRDLPLIVQEAAALRQPQGLTGVDSNATRERWRTSCPDWAEPLIAQTL